MGCCVKKKKSQYLLNKTDKPAEEPEEEKDFISIKVKLTYEDFIPLK